MTMMEPRKHGDASDGTVGGRQSRFEGSMKVTGAATYALEYPVENRLCRARPEYDSGWPRCRGRCFGGTCDAGRAAGADAGR